VRTRRAASVLALREQQELVRLERERVDRLRLA